MAIGKIINIYPFFFDEHLFFPLDKTINWYEKNLAYATDPRAAFGSYENYLTFPTFLNDENGAVVLTLREIKKSKG